jgi:hypothetical protein
MLWRIPRRSAGRDGLVSRGRSVSGVQSIVYGGVLDLLLVKQWGAPAAVLARCSGSRAHSMRMRRARGACNAQ